MGYNAAPPATEDGYETIRDAIDWNTSRMGRHAVRRGVGLMLAGWELALGLAAMFFGAIVLGTISFGLGTVAMPFMLFILPPQDAVVIVNAVVVLTTGLTVDRRRGGT